MKLLLAEILDDNQERVQVDENEKISLLAESNQGKYQWIFFSLRIKYNLNPTIIRMNTDLNTNLGG